MKKKNKAVEEVLAGMTQASETQGSEPRSAARIVARGKPIAAHSALIAARGALIEAPSASLAVRSAPLEAQYAAPDARDAELAARIARLNARAAQLDALGIKELRARTRLSQSDFAALLGVEVSTLRNWEQGRRVPTGPARALLRAIRNDPQNVIRALAAAT